MTKRRMPMAQERAYPQVDWPRGLVWDAPAKVIEYTNDLYEEGEADPLVVGFAMGRLASRRSHRRLFGEMVQRATERGRPIRLVAYEEPRRGWGYKPERVARKLGEMIVGLQLYHPADTPLHLVGHSAATSGVAHAANQLLDELPGLASVTAYTASGDRATARHRDFLDFWGIAVEETRFIRHAFGGGVKGLLGGLAAAGNLAVEAGRRFVRGPRSFVRAITGSFYHDPYLRQRVDNLNAAGVITNALVAEYDGANHYGSRVRDLRRSGFQNVDLLRNTSHLGAVTKAESGIQLMDMIIESDEKFRAVRQLGAVSLAPSV